MTTIKATCPTCGEVGLLPGEIELRVDRSGRGESFYRFLCPTCLESVRKPADDRVIRLLLSGGVHIQALEDLPEPDPPRRSLAERFDGPAITHDDLIDFHVLLQHDDWFTNLLALTG
jgi:hypothetical protein